MSQVRARLFLEIFPRGNVGSLGTKKYKILHSVALIAETHCNLPRDENSQLAQANTITVVETFNFGNHSNGLFHLFHKLQSCCLWQVLTKYSLNLSHNIESI